MVSVKNEKLIPLSSLPYHESRQKMEIGNIITNQTNFNLNQKGKKL
jgi:hypothetical protein